MRVNFAAAAAAAAAVVVAVVVAAYFPMPDEESCALKLLRDQDLQMLRLQVQVDEARLSPCYSRMVDLHCYCYSASLQTNPIFSFPSSFSQSLPFASRQL